jgi:hypothetical protein
MKKLMKMSRFQYTVLARLIARDLSGAPMRIDCRSLDALRDRGFIEYCGDTSNQTEDGRTRAIQAFMETTAAVTVRGHRRYEKDHRLRAEVATHLRLERDRALEKAASYEVTAKALRRRASQWDDALERKA